MWNRVFGLVPAFEEPLDDLIAGAVMVEPAL
jgi:hypothetical protein